MRTLIFILVLVAALTGLLLIFRPAKKGGGEEKKAPAGKRKGLSDVEAKKEMAQKAVAAAKKRDRAAQGAGEVRGSPLSQLNLTQDFTGRKKPVTDLIMEVKKGGVNVLNLFGLPGMGKTALATRFVDRMLHQFPDAQLYVNMRDAAGHALTSEDVMRRVIHGFYPLTKLSDNAEQVFTMYRSALRDQRICIVLDNVKDLAQISPALSLRRVFVVVVSEEPLALPVRIDLEVTAMDAEDRKELVEHYAPQLSFWAPEFAKACGDTTLALTIITKFIALNHTMEPTKLLDQIREERKIRDEVTKLDNLGLMDLHLDLSALLNVVYSHLPEISTAVFRKLLVFPDTFDAGAEAFVCEDQGSKNLFALVNCGLVQENGETQTYWLHGLIRDYLTGKVISAEKDAASVRLAEHYLKTLKEVAERFKEEKRQEMAARLFDQEWGNIVAGYQWAAANLEKGQEVLKLCSSYVELGSPMLHLRQMRKDRLTWLQTALQAARRLVHTEGIKTHLIQLGAEEFHHGNIVAAQEHYGKAMELCVQAGDQKGQADIFRRLGDLYIMQGKTVPAAEVLQKEIELAVLLGDKMMETDACLKLGNLHVGVAGFEEANRWFHRAFDLATEMNSLPLRALVQRYIAEMYVAMKDVFTAHKHFQGALASYQNLKDQKNECEVLKRMARVLLDMGKAKEALASLEKTLDYYKKVRDAENEAEATFLLGQIYLRMGEARRSMDLYQVAADLYGVCGKMRNSVEVLGQLVNIYKGSTEHARVVPTLGRQLSAAKMLGDRALEGQVQYELSVAIYDTGDRGEAIRQGESAMRILEEAKHPMAKVVRDKIRGWGNN